MYPEGKNGRADESQSKAFRGEISRSKGWRGHWV